MFEHLRRFFEQVYPRVVRGRESFHLIILYKFRASKSWRGLFFSTRKDYGFF